MDGKRGEEEKEDEEEEMIERLVTSPFAQRFV